MNLFSLVGINGPLFRGRPEQLPDVRPVVRRGPVDAIGTNGAELDNPEQREAAIESYRQMQRVDQERGPLMQATDIMQRRVIAVQASDSVSSAWRSLINHRIHQAPVLNEDNALVGLVGERDLLTAINIDDGDIRDTLGRTVADVMRSPIVAAGPEADIRSLARVMLERDFDGVPIVSETLELIGFVSRGDVLRAVVAEPQLSLWR